MTPREKEVFALIATGLSNGEIARELRLSLGTVRIHVSNVLRCLGVENRTKAAIAFYTDGRQ